MRDTWQQMTSREMNNLNVLKVPRNVYDQYLSTPCFIINLVKTFTLQHCRACNYLKYSSIEGNGRDGNGITGICAHVTSEIRSLFWLPNLGFDRSCSGKHPKRSNLKRSSTPRHKYNKPKTMMLRALIWKRYMPVRNRPYFHLGQKDYSVPKTLFSSWSIPSLFSYFTFPHNLIHECAVNEELDGRVQQRLTGEGLNDWLSLYL